MSLSDVPNDDVLDRAASNSPVPSTSSGGAASLLCEPPMVQQDHDRQKEELCNVDDVEGNLQSPHTEMTEHNDADRHVGKTDTTTDSIVHEAADDGVVGGTNEPSPRKVQLLGRVCADAVACPLYCEEGDFVRSRELTFESTTTATTTIMRKLSTHAGERAANRIPHPKMWHRVSQLATLGRYGELNVPVCVDDLDRERERLAFLCTQHRAIPNPGSTVLFLLPDSRFDATSYVIAGLLNRVKCSVVHVDGHRPVEDLVRRFILHQCDAVCGTAWQLCAFMYEHSFSRCEQPVKTAFVVGQLRRSQRKLIRNASRGDPVDVVHFYGSSFTGIFGVSPPSEINVYYDPETSTLHEHIPAMDTVTYASTRYLDTYEHQWHVPVLGWSSQLPRGADKEVWSLADGTPMRREEVSTPFGWVTVGEWRPTETWQYATNRAGPWLDAHEDGLKMRRRRWVLEIEPIRYDSVGRDVERVISVTSSTRPALPVYQLELPDLGRCLGAGVLELGREVPAKFRFCGLGWLSDEFETIFGRFADYQLQVSPERIVILLIHDPHEKTVAFEAFPSEMRQTAFEIVRERLQRAKQEEVIPDDYSVEPSVDVFLVPYCDFEWDPIEHTIPRVVVKSTLNM